MKIKALIHVRGGSERVKNKNIRPFAGSSLLEIKIRQLQRISRLDGIVVNTESEEMLEIARSLGAEAVKRDLYYAKSTTPMNEAHKNMAENFDADIVVCTPVTSPLIQDGTISEIVDEFEEMTLRGDQEYDSINTAYLLKDFLWKEGRPLNYDPSRLPRSQDLPDIIVPNFAVNILTRENWHKRCYVVGERPLFKLVTKEEAIDIDDELDFEFAEFLYKKLRINNEN